jgi:hypothetical protein
MNRTAIESRFDEWINRRIPGRDLMRFRTAFALIWVIYDCIDFATGQTLGFINGMMPGSNAGLLDWIQVALIACGVLVVLGVRARTFLAVGVLMRLAESYFFPLNDFFYQAVIGSILCALDFDGARKNPGSVSAWPRTVLLLQTAWIYFASAILKLNPSFLSGGDLVVRHQHQLAVSLLPYPDFFRSGVSSLTVNQAMAWATVIFELALPVVLLLATMGKRPQKGFRWAVLTLAILIHGYAAFGLNVFFFSASLLAQIYFLSREPRL